MTISSRIFNTGDALLNTMLDNLIAASNRVEVLAEDLQRQILVVSEEAGVDGLGLSDLSLGSIVPARQEGSSRDPLINTSS